MHRNLEKLQYGQFDLIIIGAGITGVCLAHDATLRGLTVAIIDKNDFGAATSSASSKLLHGGIRYLQQGKIFKVRESVMERVYFQTIAPHLTRLIPFIVPAQRSFKKSKLLLIAGMIAYQLISIGQNKSIKDKAKRIPGWRLISKQEIKQRIPGLGMKDLTGGVMFYESHMHSSERMTLGILETAYSNGAVVANYVKCNGFLIDDKKVVGIKAVDQMSGEEFEIKGEMVINAAGPWIPVLDKQITKDTGAEKGIVTAYSKGAHIVTRSLTSDCAIALATKKQNQAYINRGGRHVFIIPWRDCSLIGTTYDAYKGDLDEVSPTDSDVEELIEDINTAFGQTVLSKSDVIYTFAGIYPLIDDDVNPSVYQGTGNYQVVDHREHGLDGLVTVFGAKFTTARLLAERALNRVSGRFEKPLQKCSTKSYQTVNGRIKDIEALRQEYHKKYLKVLPGEVIDNLITNYGTAIEKVLKVASEKPSLLRRIVDNRLVIEAEVVYAARNEMVQSLDDFIFRRTGMGTLGEPGKEVINRCVDLLAGELQWDEQRISEERNNVVNKFKVR